METDLRELLGTIQNPHLRRLLNLVFRPGSSMWARYRVAPAAKHYHQAYRHGLLEHCLTVAQAVSSISATFPGIDRDVAVTGALLHDIGKLDAYDVDGDAISMSDHGRLYGEIPIGYYLVRRLIERIDGFPPELEQAVLHIILSHHGSLEHGSPVVPCTREATLVHMIDNLGGRLGSFDRLERRLPSGEQWSAYDKALGGGAYFADRASRSERRRRRRPRGRWRGGRGGGAVAAARFCGRDSVVAARDDAQQPTPAPQASRGAPSTLLVHSAPRLGIRRGIGAPCIVETPRSRTNPPPRRPLPARVTCQRRSGERLGKTALGRGWWGSIAGSGGRTLAFLSRGVGRRRQVGGLYPQPTRDRAPSAPAPAPTPRHPATRHRAHPRHDPP